MITRITLILVFLLMICAEGAGNPQSNPSAAASTSKDDKVQFPPEYVPSGRQMYKEYCAACHGSDGKGRGPVAPQIAAESDDTRSSAWRKLSEGIRHQRPSVRSRLFGSRFVRDAGVGTHFPVP
jgi:mono/diheme cytochrome c family protein